MTSAAVLVNKLERDGYLRIHRDEFEILCEYVYKIIDNNKSYYPWDHDFKAEWYMIALDHMVSGKVAGGFFNKEYAVVEVC